MTRYDLLQTLEMIFPEKQSSENHGYKDWFIGDDDGTEGVVWVCFSVDEEEETNA